MSVVLTRCPPMLPAHAARPCCPPKAYRCASVCSLCLCPRRRRLCNASDVCVQIPSVRPVLKGSKPDGGAGALRRDPWRPMAGRDPFRDPFVAPQDPSRSLPRGRPTAPCKQDPLCLSLRGRELGPGDWAHGPVRGREPASGGRANPRPLRLSPHRGEQEGSCGVGRLRFSHRLTDPRGEGDRRSSAGSPILQQSRDRREGNKAAVTMHGGTHGGPRPLHRPFFRVARLSRSLPARKTLSVSLQRMTYGPLRGREPVPWARASLPS